LISTFLPVVILYIAVEVDVARPAVLPEQVADMLLQGRRNEARPVAILEIVGAVGLVDDAVADSRLHPTGHIVTEQVQHALGKAHFLVIGWHPYHTCKPSVRRERTGSPQASDRQSVRTDNRKKDAY